MKTVPSRVMGKVFDPTYSGVRGPLIEGHTHGSPFHFVQFDSLFFQLRVGLCGVPVLNTL